MSKMFKLGDDYTAVCEFKNTSSGFKHVAKLYKNSVEIAKTQLHYLNRTWERYQFESVLNRLINLSSTDDKTKKELKGCL